MEGIFEVERRSQRKREKKVVTVAKWRARGAEEAGMILR